MQNFGEQLTAARKAAQMTQEQLADAIHVARNTISSWENGHRQPDVDTLKQLGQLLHYDFINGTSVSDSDTNLNESTDTAKEETTETVPEKQVSKVSHTRLFIIALTAVIVAIILLILLLFGRKPVGAASISIHPLENPVYAVEDPSFIGGVGWAPVFIVRNESEIPFTPTSLTLNFMINDVVDDSIELDYETVRSWMIHDTIRKEDEPLEWEFGTNHNLVTHMTIILRGTDSNGNELEYESSIIFSKDPKPEE